MRIVGGRLGTSLNFIATRGELRRRRKRGILGARLDTTNMSSGILRLDIPLFPIFISLTQNDSLGLQKVKSFYPVHLRKDYVLFSDQTSGYKGQMVKRICVECRETYLTLFVVGEGGPIKDLVLSTRTISDPQEKRVGLRLPQVLKSLPVPSVSFSFCKSLHKYLVKCSIRDSRMSPLFCV